jgi:hypothetical protein
MKFLRAILILLMVATVANAAFNINTTLSATSLTLTTPLAVASGGTGSATAGDARTALGLSIGTDVQAYSVEHNEFAALAAVSAKGTIFTHDGTNQKQLAVGTNDYVLTADSTAANGIKWAASAGGGGGLPATTAKTTTYEATNADYFIECSTAGGAWTLTLYSAASNAGEILVITKTTSDASILTIDGASSETINGNLTDTIVDQWGSIMIYSNGTNWIKF